MNSEYEKAAQKLGKTPKKSKNPSDQFELVYWKSRIIEIHHLIFLPDLLIQY